MTLLERELRQRCFDGGRALSVAPDEQPESVIWEEALVPALQFLVDHAKQRRTAGEPVSLEQEMSDLVIKFRRPEIVTKKRKPIRRPNDEREVEKILKGVREDLGNPFSLVGELEEVEVG
jgi:hypothetical protein